MFKNCSNSKCTDPDCKDKFYRAIIMDLQMPVMDGFEASEKILEYQSRQPNLAHKCKIVALTAYRNQETTHRCLNIGMEQVYNKPANHEDIREIICLHFYGLSHDHLATFLKIEENLKV